MFGGSDLTYCRIDIWSFIWSRGNIQFFESLFREDHWPEDVVSGFIDFLDDFSSPEVSSALSSGRVLLGRRCAPAPF